MCLTSEESAALAGLPHVARLIYLCGLRPYMDYATGIVGIRRGVSWQSIKEMLYVEPHQGIKGGSPSEMQCRRALVWLQKAGLLSANRGGKRLVFECLLARRDNAVRNKADSLKSDKATVHPAPATIRHHQGYNAMDRTKKGKADSEKTGKADTPPLLRASTTTSSAARSEEGAADNCAAQAKADAAQRADRAALPEERRFSMYYAWQADAAHFALLASAHGVNPDSLSAEVLQQWCMYWTIQQPGRKQTQSQWEYQLVQHLKHRQDEAAEKAARQAELAAQKPAQAAQARAEKAANKAATVVKLRTVQTTPAASAVGPAPAPTGTTTLNTMTDNPFAQELTQNEQETAILGYLWDEMRGLYGWRFLANYGDKPSLPWAHALRGLSAGKLTNGMRNLIEQAPSWPPSALEFRGLCLQIPGLPSSSKAWTQALTASYRHEAVQRAAKLCGLDALKSARAGHCDRFAVQALKERFQMHYALIVETLQSGETPEAGSAAAEHSDTADRAQQRQTLQALLSEQNHWLHLIAHCHREADKNSLRVQLEAVQAQLAEHYPEALKTEPAANAKACAA